MKKTEKSEFKKIIID
jgi:hypothetical protein